MRTAIRILALLVALWFFLMGVWPAIRTHDDPNAPIDYFVHIVGLLAIVGIFFHWAGDDEPREPRRRPDWSFRKDKEST